MAEKLTPQQEMAIFDRGGSLLVSAAAGSGKTKVLVDRLLSYIMDPVNPANIDDFLIITYTKAAAAELRGKIASKLTERIAENPANRHLQKQMQRLYLAKISTVHSFCSDILKEYAYRLDLPADFRMAEETETKQLKVQIVDQVLDEIYKNIHQYPDVQMFIDTQGLDRDDRKIPDIIQKVFDSARCHLDPSHWLQQCVDATDTSSLTDASQTPWGEYLLQDLHNNISLHIDAFRNCLKAVEFMDGMEKVASVISEDVVNLERLLGCKSWDAVHDFGAISWRDFPGKYSDKELAGKIKAVRDACKDDVKEKLVYFVDDTKQVFSDLENTSSAARGLIFLVDVFDKEYAKLKKRQHVLDFADLEHMTLDLLLGKNRSTPTAAAREISRRFREIMVDEYQDSNQVQDSIFDTLTAERHNCFMVGDVKQSIYQFRLADPQIFIDKYDAFVKAENAEAGQPRKVLLSHNFRSAGQVINAVNDVFAHCMSPQIGGLVYGEDEMLHEGIAHEEINEPEIELHCITVNEDTYPEEAAFVAARIKELLENGQEIRGKEGLRKIKPEDIAILMRSPSSTGAHFCYALWELGIPCAMGGTENLLDTEEVSFLYALLQTVSNPLQDIPLVTALSGRIFCFTADELSAIRKDNKYTNFYHALVKSESEKAKAFLEMLDEFRQQAKMCSVTQLIDYIFMRTGMDSIFAAMPDGAERTANIHAFCDYAAAYEGTGKKELSQFLEQIDAQSEKGLKFNSEQAPAGCVKVMSIHKSKGLEFPVVFLSTMERRFSQKSLQEPVLCDGKLGLGLNCVNGDYRVRYPSIARKAIKRKIQTDNISEEMRVLYVAMTRARDRLIMTYATPYMKKALTDIGLRIDMSSRLLLTSDVNCIGKWILQTAMCRTEAGQLHAIGGHPACTAVRKNPWLIRLTSAPNLQDIGRYKGDDNADDEEDHLVEQMGRFLGYQYAHNLATLAPSKQTATQMKGRIKDEESAENTLPVRKYSKSFRKPTFVAPNKLSAAGYGTAVHTVMQYLNFANCFDTESVSRELDRLAQEGYVSEEAISMIDASAISAFFATKIGKQILDGAQVLREFKFSLLADAGKYVSGLENEKILMQGVVDCALIEEDGITIVDFKTDRFAKEEENAVVEQYRPQVTLYADALSEIYGQKIKNVYLYFFHTKELISVND